MPKQGEQLDRVLERRARVATLLCRGKRQHEIAALLNLHGSAGRKMVCQDVAAVRREWTEGAVADFDSHKARLRAELVQLKAEAWSEWERSREPVRVETTVREVRPPHAPPPPAEQVNEYEAVPAPPPEPQLVKEVTTLRTEGRVADAALGRLVMQLIVEEEELLGIKAQAGENTTAPPVCQFRIVVPPDEPEAKGAV